MKTIKFYLLLLFLAVIFKGATQVPFTAGNIVVYRVGTGAATLTNAATAVFLDEYTTAGVLVQSIPMPVAASGANQILTAAGIGTAEGLLNLSTDGQYLVFTGYNAVTGTASIGGSPSITSPRTIALVMYDATINTTTALTDFSSGGPVRAAVSTNGANLWACGNGTTGGTGGVRYTTVGSTTSTRLNTTGPTMLRNVLIAGAQLYVAGNGGSPRIGTVGTGLPTTTGQTITNLSGLPVIGTPGQFVFVDLNTGVAGPDVLYFTDANAGIYKYSLVAGSWASNGIVGTATEDYRGLAAKVSGTTVTLFATRTGANSITIEGGEVVSLTDASGYNGAFSTTPVVLATSITDATAFRGVALVPVQSIIILPVKLISFTAGKINKDVKLNWSVASATDFSHFEIERSIDGRIFSTAGKVDFLPTNNGNADYHFTDAGIINTVASPGTLYYRLKMTDIDGKYEYSKVVAVGVNEKMTGLINAYPAPFTNEVFVKIRLLRTEKVSLSITDAGGRVVKSMQLFLPAGETSITVHGLDNLQKGLYLLRANNNDKVTTLKLIK
jgi:hypothetical protein